MKDNKPAGFLSFITDGRHVPGSEVRRRRAARSIDFYRENGYAQAQVGTAADRDDHGLARTARRAEIRLRIPVDEGTRYTIGKFEITGNTTLKPDALRALFKIKEGDVLQPQEDPQGHREGQGGLRRLRLLAVHARRRSSASARHRSRRPASPSARSPPPPIVDITMQMNEGKQFFVNRITFIGNTTTHDTVIRRELRVAEGGVFNTEALKESVRRLNQLGYFKPLESKEDEIRRRRRRPGTDGQVDIKLKFQEQNRNQLSFGAGVSQFDGFFGQLSFQTVELPRPRRDRRRLAAEGLAGAASISCRSASRTCSIGRSPPASTCSRASTSSRCSTRSSRRGTNTVVRPAACADYTRLFLGYSYDARPRVRHQSRST